MPSMNHTTDTLRVKQIVIDEEGNVAKRFPRIDAEGQLKNTLQCGRKLWPALCRKTGELQHPLIARKSRRPTRSRSSRRDGARALRRLHREREGRSFVESQIPPNVSGQTS